MATIIKTTGERVEMGYRPTLEQMQKAVGGYIELVSEPDKDIFVNEEGLLLDDLEFNFEVSNMCGRLILGDAVVCAKGEIE